MLIGSSFLVLGGIISYISMRILIWAGFKTGQDDYAKLIEHCFGNAAKIYLDIIQVIFILGSVVAYNILVS